MGSLLPGDRGMSLADSIRPMEDQSPDAQVKALPEDEAAPSHGTTRRLSGWWLAKSI